MVRDLTDDRLRTAHRAALFALASFREANGTIKPSVAQLGRAVGLSPKQARRTLQDLAKWGYVIASSATTGGRLEPNRYLLVLPSKGVLPPMGVLTPKGGGYSLPREGDTPAGGRGVLPPMGASEDLSEDLSEDPTEDVAHAPLVLSSPETKTQVIKRPKTDSRIQDSRIQDLWTHYLAARARHGVRTVKKQPDKADLRATREALKCFTVEALKQSIDGLMLSDFHVERRDLAIEYAMRSKNVERFIALANGTGRQRGSQGCHGGASARARRIITDEELDREAGAA